ncbi:MAG: hypothetical protein DWQ01_03360 [Planctomycetota bacterium]|nr:MAG: hypothetical protein DWQ01_03360 [Planctomycetota bacterium]
MTMDSPPPNEESEAELSHQPTSFLLRAARDGRRPAVDALFERYLPRITRIAALRTGFRLKEFADFEDIVQESMLEAFLHLANLQIGHDGAFLNWLATIVENNIRDQQRRQLAQKRGAGKVRPFGQYGTTLLTQAFFAGQEPTPSQAMEAGEMEVRLENALLQLNERHRRVIDLRRLCGLSYDEIAEQMDLGGAASARSLFARALNQLTSIL